MMTTGVRERPRILFLFSDTGGGHRSATKAVVEVLQLEFQNRISTVMIDILKDHSPFPFNKLPKLYPRMVQVPRIWGVVYHLSNGMRRTHLINSAAWPYIRRSIQRFIAENPCHLIVSAHPLVNAPLLRGFGADHPAIITLVTDLTTAHAFWYHPDVDLCIVPSDAARQQALEKGLNPNKVMVLGLPVSKRFCQTFQDRTSVRKKLGWSQDRPIILLAGGGEGMGPIESAARGLSINVPSASLVIITGRNHRLKERLEKIDWQCPTRIYGFIQDMPEFMHAADILVTKAGPGTISEALISGLPMVLNYKLPGQEDGNVDYVVMEEAGIWAPRVNQTIAAVRHWLDNPEALAMAVKACRRIARPSAAHDVAQILMQKLNLSLGATI